MSKIDEKAVAEVAQATQKKKKVRNPYAVVTFWTSVALSVMFVVDLVLFLMNMLQWYIFVALLAIYLIVFPIALLVIYRSSKNQSKEELTLEVEAELLSKTSEPDLTKIYEE